jgi:hypothetical protein
MSVVKGKADIARTRRRAEAKSTSSSASGLPIGVLVTGRRLREDLCLEAAEAIEARLGLATPIDPMRGMRRVSICRARRVIHRCTLQGRTHKSSLVVCGWLDVRCAG